MCGVICFLPAAPTPRIGTAIIITGLILFAEATKPTGDQDKISDRPPGRDGKRGSTGGRDAGKKFKPLTPAKKAERDGRPCRYCERPTTTSVPRQPNSYERDHIDPRARGGNNGSENEGDSCFPCNRQKGAKSPEEFEEWLKQRRASEPQRPPPPPPLPRPPRVF